MSEIVAIPDLLFSTIDLYRGGTLSAEEMELLGLTQQHTDWKPTVRPKILYVDKAWDGMNFLLSKAGEDPQFPYTFINNGGIELNATEEDWGYGPPRAFDSSEVQQIARMMKDIDIEALFEQACPEETRSRRRVLFLDG